MNIKTNKDQKLENPFLGRVIPRWSFCFSSLVAMWRQAAPKVAICFKQVLNLIQTIHTDKEPTIKANKVAMLYRSNFIAGKTITGMLLDCFQINWIQVMQFKWCQRYMFQKPASPAATPVSPLVWQNFQMEVPISTYHYQHPAYASFKICKFILINTIFTTNHHERRHHQHPYHHDHIGCVRW